MIFYAKQKDNNIYLIRYILGVNLSAFLKLGAPGFDGCNRAYSCMSRILGSLVNHPGTMISADYGYVAAA